jgi:hypothetical protein
MINESNIVTWELKAQIYKFVFCTPNVRKRPISTFQDTHSLAEWKLPILQPRLL